jgi:hypothetical protein
MYGRDEKSYKILIGKREGKRTLERPSLGRGKVWILEKSDLRVWIGFVWLRTGTSFGLL